jgi:hypothetical protein
MSVARARRRPLLVIAVAALMAAGLSGPLVTGASADPAATATAMTVTISRAGSPAPDVPSAPDILLAKGKAFTVTVNTGVPDGAGGLTPLAASFNKDTTITLTSVAATGSTSAIKGKIVILKGTTEGHIDLTPTAAANGVVVTATVTGGSTDAQAIPPATSETFDVMGSESSPNAPGKKFWSTKVDGTACSPDKTTTTCADLVLPNGTLQNLVLSTGLCDPVLLGCGSNKLLVQALVDLNGYSRTSPATLIVKCDKTACPGSGVPSYHLLVNLAPQGSLVDPTTTDGFAPACTDKGVVDPLPNPHTYCVDYRQSKRDNAGDLYLFLLFAQDARAGMP